MAAYNGTLGAVELLLQAGADVTSTAHPMGMTPLHAAAFSGHREVCAQLIKAGAPPAVRDGRGRTASAWAARRGHAELALFLSSQAN